MNRNDGLEVFGAMMNDYDQRLPKGRSRCFDIGIWGGCGVNCAAFLDGECDEPQEISYSELVDEHGEREAQEIAEYYPGVWKEQS